ncbi:MAG: class I SAM-dependent methyltransferase [Candidatus Latescibacterota bacterium]
MQPERNKERDAFGLRLPKASHPALLRLKGLDSPRVQSHKTWNAGWLLIDYLQRQALSQGLQILDIGCGWGLSSGIYCAHSTAAFVTAADIDPRVFPYLQLHAEIYEVKVTTRELSFEQIDSALLTEQDLVIGADICFRENMVEPILRLVERALKAGVHRIVLADPGRPSFRNLSSHCVDQLVARSMNWSVEEPLIEWPGQRPILRGQLLLWGPWRRISPP